MSYIVCILILGWSLTQLNLMCDSVSFNSLYLSVIIFVIKHPPAQTLICGKLWVLSVTFPLLSLHSGSAGILTVLQLMPSVRLTSNTKSCRIISSSVCVCVCVWFWTTSLFSSQMTTQINMTKQPVKAEGGTRNKREEERLKWLKQHIQGFWFQIREWMRLGQTIQCSLIKCHTVALPHYRVILCLCRETFCFPSFCLLLCVLSRLHVKERSFLWLNIFHSFSSLTYCLLKHKSEL